ncbi:MAG: lysophospholipid acyltransferase family protein [Chloroherpetonaceae bacterium]|nr:lysophospholipid acyltransferase family protein [Chthonomonadaceae bacterium]MDW8208005.1 lysophospholipid acyltransferase family protein [Chloroherpetonaceae bacterium]
MATHATPTSTTASPEVPASETEAQRRERLRHERRAQRLGWLIYLIARTLYRTLRLSLINPERLDPQGKGAIFVTWHGRSLIPANLFRNRGYWALISLSRDGEIQTNVFRHFGFQIVRGSTGRGGVRAALQMARKVKEGGVLAFTPDGPRGPTHRVQHGVILMAEKSGAPIIPIGVSADRRWLMKSWDAYMIPKPFARAFCIVGDPIYIPPDLDDAARETMARRVEVAINRLEKEAERLAGHPNYPAEWTTEL